MISTEGRKLYDLEMSQVAGRTHSDTERTQGHLPWFPRKSNKGRVLAPMTCWHSSHCCLPCLEDDVFRQWNGEIDARSSRCHVLVGGVAVLNTSTVTACWHRLLRYKYNTVDKWGPDQMNNFVVSKVSCITLKLSQITIMAPRGWITPSILKKIACLTMPTSYRTGTLN